MRKYQRNFKLEDQHLGIKLLYLRDQPRYKDIQDLERFAEECNISKQKMARIQTGSSDPTIGELKKICEVLNISADYLLGLSTDFNISEEDITFPINESSDYNNFINLEKGKKIKKEQTMKEEVIINE